jgi:SAM-dependent methyltransferase
MARNTQINAWAPPRSVNLARKRVVSALAAKLAASASRRILIVGGGTQKEDLEREFDAGRRPWSVYTDIDIRADVDVFVDAHDLPFQSGSFDAVITTAVLEHVLYPERVVAEIHRVLKIGGLLYSELPFMQQVHEGAYDFTRYSLAGHRRLLNGFEEIEAGMVSGPGTALVWAIESFLMCFPQRRFSKILLRFVSRWAFAWLRHLDRRLQHNPTAMDGASCTYFFGAKAAEKVADENIIARYSGASHMEHL